MRHTSEVPPSLAFHVALASDEERAEIMTRMSVLHRQTMNLRTMDRANLLRMREGSKHGAVVAWAGFVLRDAPGVQAELFSLYVEESHRSFLLGLYLETLRAELVQRSGVRRALVRMDSASNSLLLEYRTRNRLLTVADDLANEVVAECRTCSLYGTHCTAQSYLWASIPALIERGINRLGFSPSTREFPGMTDFDPAIFRTKAR
jgi:hypothetical protein